MQVRNWHHSLLCEPHRFGMLIQAVLQKVIVELVLGDIKLCSESAEGLDSLQECQLARGRHDEGGIE
jgi:hypothetical protein